MLEVKRILCPTDFSEASKRAIEVAVSMAESFGAEIHLMHVVPAMPHITPTVAYAFDVPEYERLLRLDAQKRLSELAKTLPGKVKAHEIVAHGDAADGILRAIEENAIDLVVIATAGLRGWKHALFGSVAEKVVRMASCPVLSIRRPQSS